jgi:anti-sigma factor RsiW
MEKTVRLNAEQREDLVAYLDGELTDEKVQQIDAIIARSEVARHEVEALARTFELLDILPAMRASDDFASKTLTSLKVTEQPFILTEQWWFPHVRRTVAIVGWLMALLLSGWAGFQCTRHWIPNPDEDVLRDLPVIENLDRYQEVGDVNFLKELKRQGLFDDALEK